MSCGVEMCPAGTVGGVTMRGGGFSRKRAWRGGSRVSQNGGSCPAGQLRMLGTYPEVIRATPGPMNGYGVVQSGGFSRKRAWRGGGCGCSANRMLVGQRGGGCGCMNKTLGLIGGYRATARNRKYLRRFRQGKSIGFTMRSSLKAKGLIPRANGTYKVSAKYKTRRSRK